MFASKAATLARHPDPTSSFVTRDASTGNLLLNGSRFRFGGANAANDIGTVGSGNGNAYGGTVHSGSYITTHAQVDAYLNSASQMHLGVVKATWSAHTSNHVDAVEPTLGSYNAAALDPLDYALQQCALLGIRLIIPFAEEYTVKPWYVSVTGGGATDNFYTRPATVAAYKNHISFVLDHLNPYTGRYLRDEPGVLCWQIGNEFLAPTITEAQYVTWADSIVDHIKVTKGAKQLVQDGHYGPYGLTSKCDIYDQHAYDQYRTPSFLIAEAQACHAAGKAYFIGEFDVYDSAALSGAWTLDKQLDAWERSQYIDGSTFWDLLAPLTNWSDGYTLHYPGTSNNMQTRGDQLRDSAWRMSGIAAGTFVFDSFTGLNGTPLSTHVGETGATYDHNDSYTGIAKIQNNRLYASSGATQVLDYASGVPPSGDYEVSVDVYVASLLSGSWAGVAARALTKADISYTGYIWNNAGTNYCYLTWQPGDHNFSGGTSFAVVTGLVVGSSHSLKVKVQQSGTSTLLTLYWDNVPIIGPITDAAPYNSAGRAGVYLGNSTATTGFHLKNLLAA